MSSKRGRRAAPSDEQNMKVGGHRGTNSPRPFPPTACVLPNSPGHDARRARAAVRMPVALLPRTLVAAAVWPSALTIVAMKQALTPRTGVVLALRVVVHAHRAFWPVLDPTSAIVLPCAATRVQLAMQHFSFSSDPVHPAIC